MAEGSTRVLFSGEGWHFWEGWRTGVAAETLDFTGVAGVAGVAACVRKSHRLCSPQIYTNKKCFFKFTFPTHLLWVGVAFFLHARHPSPPRHPLEPLGLRRHPCSPPLLFLPPLAINMSPLGRSRLAHWRFLRSRFAQCPGDRGEYGRMLPGLRT